MDVFSTRAEFLDVNCYAVRAAGRSDCILIDAGYDCAPGLERLLTDEGLAPQAIFLTHGHPDHVLGLTNVLSTWDVPVHLGQADRYRLDDPASTLSPQFAAMLAPLVADWSAPEVNDVADAARFDIAGPTITAVSAPGHTEGSTLWRVVDDTHEVIFTGDVVFAGSIGRVDLPGGDGQAMQASLQAFATLPDVPIYPGHGPASAVGRELASNPFF